MVRRTTLAAAAVRVGEAAGEDSAPELRSSSVRSEYKSKSVIEDPAKAKAAGLVMPDKTL